MGLAHEAEKYRDSLVLDHMQPLRPIVDREIFQLVLNNEMNPGDFAITNEAFFVD
jgi:CRISPR/Cas system-associated endonuclease Cas1